VREKRYTGSCLCGAIRFSFVGRLDDIYFCHCSQCRKNYGLYGAFAGVIRGALVTDSADALRPYKSSKNTTRTFCGVCGSPIAWDRTDHERIYVLMGALDGNVRAAGAKHIHVKDKGGYYTICE
jgi:hypothetical protein